MDNYNEFDNQFESQTESTQSFAPETEVKDASTNGNSSVSLKEKAVTALSDVRDRAVEMKGKIGEQAAHAGKELESAIDSNRTKASQGLRSTSQRIERVATYLDDRQARDMGDDLLRSSEEIIRKHPGKSLIAGVLVGLFLGRMFR